MRRSAPGHRREAGFSIVEAVVALTIGATVALGLMSSILAGSRLQEKTQEFGLSCRSVRQVYERIRNGDLDERFDEYAANPIFTNGDVEVEVRFPEQVLVDEIGGPVPATWRYRDLDADGQVERDPSSTLDASLLPVTVIVRSTDGEMRSSFLVTEK